LICLEAGRHIDGVVIRTRQIAADEPDRIRTQVRSLTGARSIAFGRPRRQSFAKCNAFVIGGVSVFWSGGFEHISTDVPGHRRPPRQQATEFLVGLNVSLQRFSVGETPMPPQKATT